MIDTSHQRRGYGRALMLELLRRLPLDPDAEMTAVSHRRDNRPMGALLASVGFGLWSAPWPDPDPDPDPDEMYLRLPP